ncbi:MAG: 3-oxoacyl-[acyl-carrier-protein] reductase [Armatimonadetes bacterium CG2_30_59_28]|nr:3-oxoacyl-[acyl-carrier-protein] reductase [Armatimonadota bacterium]OIO92295.1 MAG: 3-oxoacyl-[acyl-carrier-protein] reductase [Armatimonadetes bacterium CG2_30_59_28]PIU65301.1 MAG: 3-oxoacyl-[acyl-carrier-protein] reductase [Armatimonadetes bacterium CG07_land_8_20_14_0_80_59_28]PIX42685.1 MAG: 3-oxoacyl-[acyl-carrier-protein] reductase [Armatimonadetes bacterium CG_4_8_14_3_um_filter_58_9]PIY40655.1 MAG: 3-oxoacyl-[acyl-carrier-protein] reductase [Armatimonadetes bacterium CG_4_10_14_3_u
MAHDGTPRVAIVTGSSRGIGRAIALELAHRGSRVVINYRAGKDAAEAVRREIELSGGEALVVRADVSVEADVRTMMEKTIEQFSRLDILVNNAGVLQDNFVSFMSEEQWDLVLDVNLKSAFFCTKHASKQMAKQRWGRIINISSDAGLMGDMLRTNYSAAKAGLIGLTKSTARELAARGITANAIAPGYIETDMTSEWADQKRKQMLERIPMQRLGSPQEVARAAAYLASEQASYVTGQVLSVDGGLHM